MDPMLSVVLKLVMKGLIEKLEIENKFMFDMTFDAQF